MEQTKFKIKDFVRIEDVTKDDCGGNTTPETFNGLEGQIIDYWEESDKFNIKISSQCWVACDKKFLRKR